MTALARAAPVLLRPHAEDRRGLALHAHEARVRTGGRLSGTPRTATSDDGGPAAHVPHVLLERWAARRDEIRVVTGHFPLCTIELLDADFTTFTVLREPVERTLSYLRHHRETTPGRLASSRSRRSTRTPRDFRHFIENHMVKMLSLRAEEMTDGMMTVVDLDRGRLRTGQAGAARAWTSSACRRTSRDSPSGSSELFGWRLGPPVHEQRDRARPKSPPLCGRRIAEDNALDMELYEYARKLRRRDALADDQRPESGRSVGLEIAPPRSDRRRPRERLRDRRLLLPSRRPDPRSSRCGVGGSRQRVERFGLPRDDVYAAGGRRPGGPLSAYRSGFVAVVDLAPVERPARLEIELILTLADGRRGDPRRPGRSRSSRSSSRPRTPPPPTFPGPAGGRVAICMATYEPPADLLRVQLDSIREQTHGNWVCVISDDGSSDAVFRAPAGAHGRRSALRRLAQSGAPRLLPELRAGALDGARGRRLRDASATRTTAGIPTSSSA